MQLSEYLEVGKRMKTARTNVGMSQRDMAKQLSISNSAYSNYENGYSEPPAEIILKFCDILHIFGLFFEFLAFFNKNSHFLYT